MNIKIFESDMELLVLKIKSKCLFFTGYSSEPIIGDGYNGSKQTLTFTGLPGNDKEELAIDLTVRNGRISLITNSDLEDFDRLVFNVSFIRDSSVEEFTTGGYTIKTYTPQQDEVDLEKWLYSSHAELICAEKLMFSADKVTERIVQFILNRLQLGG